MPPKRAKTSHAVEGRIKVTMREGLDIEKLCAPPGANSPIWRYFALVDEEDEFAICLYCVNQGTRLDQCRMLE
jgi:hypothetical protein